MRGRLLVLAVLAAMPFASAAGNTPAAACRVPKAAADENPQVAPDGSFILFTRRQAACPLRRSVWLSDLAGHHLHRLARAAFGIGATWRADGLVSLSRPTGTTLLSPNGVVRERVAVQHPFWAPDSRRALYQDSTSDQIHFWPSGAVLAGRSNFIASPNPWSPASDRFAYIHVDTTVSQVVVARADGTIATTLYTARSVDGPTWSPDGTEVAFTAGDRARRAFVARAVSNDDLGQVTPEFARMGHPAWSAAGEWLAFAGRLKGDRESGIYVVHPHGGDFHRIASNLARADEDVSWLPENVGVAYAARSRGCPRIGVFVATTTGSSRRLTNACRVTLSAVLLERGLAR